MSSVVLGLAGSCIYPPGNPYSGQWSVLGWWFVSRLYLPGIFSC